MKSKLLRSPFLRSVFVLVSGTTLAQIIPILITPIISRLFSPDDFGALGLFTAFITVASSTVGLSFSLAIVSDISEKTAARLALLGLLSVVPMSIVCVGILIYLRQSEILGFQALSPVHIFWAWAALVAIGLFSIFRYWQVRAQHFGAISRATVSQSIGRILGQLGAGFVAPGAGGLIFAEFLGRTFGVTMLGRMSRKALRQDLVGTTVNDLKRTAVEFRKFPLLNMPSSVLNSMGTASLIPLIAGTYGLTASGQFSMGYRVLTLPIAVISSAVADVFHAQLVKAAQRGMPAARLLFLRVSMGLLALGVIPSIAVMIWGPDLFRIVLGNEWHQAGVVAAGLMPWILASFAVSPVSRVVMVFRGQEMKLAYDILNIVGIVGVVQWGAHHSWSIGQTATTLGITQTFAYFVYFLLLWRILNVKSGVAEPSES